MEASFSINNSQFQNNSIEREVEPDRKSSIKWLHGTSGLSLLLLKRTNFKVIPTGRLLERKIAPLFGELHEGITLFGVNQYATSGMRFQNRNALPVVWSYAKIQTNHSRFEQDLESKIEENLKKIEDDFKKNPKALHHAPLKSLALSVLQLRQWNEQLYFDKFSERIKKLQGIERVDNYTLHSRILRMRKRMELALPKDEVACLSDNLEKNLLVSAPPCDEDQGDYDNEENHALYCLDLAMYAHQKRQDVISGRISGREYCNFVLDVMKKTDYFDYKMEIDKIERGLYREIGRITKAFDDTPTPIRLTQEEITKIKETDEFPLILASTKEEGLYEEGQLLESSVRRPLSLGKDIDVMITTRERLQEVQRFVVENGFEKEISVYTDEQFRVK